MICSAASVGLISRRAVSSPAGSRDLAFRRLALEERLAETRAQVVGEAGSHLLCVDAVEHVALEVDHRLEVLPRLLGGAPLGGFTEAERRRDRDAGDQREQGRDDARDQCAIAARELAQLIDRARIARQDRP